MSLTFTLVSASTTTTITPVCGSLTYGSDQDQRGGRVTPVVAAGNARNGSCQVVITDSNRTDVIALHSDVGPGDYTIAGSDITGYESYLALVDVVEGEGEDGVEVATITWKGTVN